MMKVYFTCDWFTDGEYAQSVLSRLRKTPGRIRMLTEHQEHQERQGLQGLQGLQEHQEHQEHQERQGHQERQEHQGLQKLQNPQNPQDPLNHQNPQAPRNMQAPKDFQNPQAPPEPADPDPVWYSSREIIYEEDYISFCEGKASLGEQMADADLFLFLAGTGPGGSDTGSCRACGNYNVWSGMCGLGKSCDDRGFADFECGLAKKLGIMTAVLYPGERINRKFCPKQLRDAGVHLCERDLFPDNCSQNVED